MTSRDKEDTDDVAEAADAEVAGDDELAEDDEETSLRERLKHATRRLRYRNLALDTLADLLGSDDEKIRLQAAQIILAQQEEEVSPSGILKKLESLKRR